MIRPRGGGQTPDNGGDTGTEEPDDNGPQEVDMATTGTITQESEFTPVMVTSGKPIKMTVNGKTPDEVALLGTVGFNDEGLPIQGYFTDEGLSGLVTYEEGVLTISEEMSGCMVQFLAVRGEDAYQVFLLVDVKDELTLVKRPESGTVPEPVGYISMGEGFSIKLPDGNSPESVVLVCMMSGERFTTDAWNYSNGTLTVTSRTNQDGEEQDAMYIMVYDEDDEPQYAGFLVFKR